MSFVKSPYFPAIICLVIIGIVIFMLFRDVSSMKGTVSELVTQHNNAQKALETHGGAIKSLQQLGAYVVDDEYDENEDGEFAHMPTIEEEPSSDPGPSKSKKV